MRPATWLFYSAVTLFLGLSAVGSGGAIALGTLFFPDLSDYSFIAQLLTALALVLAMVFGLGGIQAMLLRGRPGGDELNGHRDGQDFN